MCIEGQTAIGEIGGTKSCMCSGWDKLLYMYCGTNFFMCSVVGQTAVCVIGRTNC